MENYLFQKLSCSIELTIKTLYVSLEFANLVSDSDLHSTFLRAFALRRLTVRLFFLHFALLSLLHSASKIITFCVNEDITFWVTITFYVKSYYSLRFYYILSQLLHFVA
jgi:hypothetical protein